MIAREELLAQARRHMWAAWQLSSEELASQAADTLIGLGMLVPEGGAAELERLQARVAELEEQLAALSAQGEVLRGKRAEESADRLTRLLAPTQALREDVYESPLRHDYRTPHDMPEPGAPYGRADCPVCALSIPLTSAGVLCFHGECDGGGKVPAESGGAR